MTKQIYIGNLPFETTEEQIRKLCAPFGEVKSVAMIKDRESGRFRGFCFVEMEEKAATAAIAALNGKKVDGRKIKANKARPRKGQGQRQGNQQSDNRQPLHERTQRGPAETGNQHFPHSGGGRGRPSREYREYQGRENGNSDFPHSGGSSRGNR